MKFSVRTTRLIIATFMLSNIISAIPLAKPRQSNNGKVALKPIKNPVIEADISLDPSADDADLRDGRNGLILTIDSKIDFLQVTTDNCCSTLNSKIDALHFESAACCATINSKLDNLAAAESKTDFDVNSCCVTLNSKLDILLVDDQCAATAIVAATTLTAAGTYCLAHDLTSSLPQTILINGSNIVLNLNGHRLSNNNVSGSGVAIQVGAVNNVVIKNGFLQADAASSTVSSVGINVVGTRNVSVENVFVGALSGANNWGFGIQLQSADSVAVFDSQFHNNNVNGIAVSSSSNVRVERCLVTNNGAGDSGDGIVVAVNGAPSICTNVYFVDCQVNNNFANGLSIDNSSFVHAVNCSFSNNGADAVNVSDATCVKLIGCAAERSGSLPQTEDGFSIVNSDDVVLQECSACGFDIGYFAGGVAGVTSLNILNSVAKGNHIGFDLTAVNNSAIVQGCIADNNTNSPTPGVGFNDNGSGKNQYYANRACNNNLNYNGVASAPITSPANDRGVMNVDCTNSQVDQVAQILSKVCVLDSKIDVVIEDNSKIDADLLNCCFTLSSQIDAVDTELAECCATLNSKVDRVQVTDLTILSHVDGVQDSLNACCFTISSQIDFLDVIDLRPCCFTIESKIDALSNATSKVDSDLLNCCFTLSSQIDFLDVIDLRPCCFTIESKVDEVQATLDDCCATLNSKIDELQFDTSACCATINSKLDNLAVSESKTDYDINSCCVTLNSKIDILLVDDQCASKAILGATTLTAAGTYCLAQDVTSTLPQTILVNGSNIIVNLNGHRLSNNSSTGSGVAIQVGAVSNVVIKNGFIQADESSSTVSSVGINLVGSQNVSVENVFVGAASVGNNWGFGIQVQSANSISIVDSQFHNNNVNGIAVSSSVNVRTERCLVTNNGAGDNGDGIVVAVNGAPSVSSNVYFVDCQVNNNFANGLSIQDSSFVHAVNCSFSNNGADAVDVSSSSCIELANCAAERSSTLPKTEDGFSIVNSTDVTVKECSACGFDIGFLNSGLTGVKGLNLIGCVAKQNHIGFDLSNAANTAIVQGCTANDNTNSPTPGVGFNDSGLGINQYYANRACGNNLNYNGVVAAPITSPANDRGVMNVDCTNSQIDQVAEILSKVTVLDSKIDVVIEDNSKIDADLLNCCFTLSSQIDSLDADLAQCCATLNSKVDRVQVTDLTILSHVDGVQDSLNACCFTLSSQIDFLDIIDVRPCCYTLESKVDQVQATDLTILSHVDGVQDSLNACCFTLSSQIDFLDIIDVRPCCYTLESKIDAIQATNDTIVSRVDSLTNIVVADFAATFTVLADVRKEAATIESKVDALTDVVNADFAGTFTTLAALAAEGNTTSSKVDLCCATLNSKLDALNGLVVSEFAATFTVLADVRSEEGTIESKVDALTNVVNADFAGTFTALAALATEGNTTSSKVDLCCATLNSKLDALNGLVGSEFAATFTVLADVRSEEGTIESKVDALTDIVNADFAGTFTALAALAADDTTSSKVDLCCAALNSKLDALNDLVVSDFAGTFTALAALAAEGDATSSKADLCCATLNSKLDGLTDVVNADFAGTFTVLADLATQEEVSQCCSTLTSRVDSLTRVVVADFAGTFTALDSVQTTDNAVLSKLDACCFELNSKVEALSNDNFNLGSKLDMCCAVVDSKVQFLIDNLLLP